MSASSAIARTRPRVTFRLEVELPNPDAKLPRRQRRHPPSVRNLSGEISPGFWCSTTMGVAAHVESGVVHFKPVQIVSDAPTDVGDRIADGAVVITWARNL